MDTRIKKSKIIIQKHEAHQCTRNLTNHLLNITNTLSKTLKKHNIQLSTNNNLYKLRNQIKSTKNKAPNIDKSDVYEISCGTPGCEYKYIGQSRRAIKNRFIEHLRAYKNNRSDSSAEAHHMLVNEDSRSGSPHKFDISNLRMLHPMSDQRKLDFLESYHI
jgi:hypothetical protein